MYQSLCINKKLLCSKHTYYCDTLLEMLNVLTVKEVN